MACYPARATDTRTLGTQVVEYDVLLTGSVHHMTIVTLEQPGSEDPLQARSQPHRAPMMPPLPPARSPSLPPLPPSLPPSVSGVGWLAGVGGAGGVGGVAGVAGLGAVRWGGVRWRGGGASSFLLPARQKLWIGGQRWLESMLGDSSKTKKDPS